MSCLFRVHLVRTYVELLRWEWSTADPRSVRLDDTDGLADHLGWNTQASTHAANGGRRRRDIGVGTEVDVQHQGVGAFDEDLLVFAYGFVDEGNTVDDVGFQTFCKSLCGSGSVWGARQTITNSDTYLVANNLTLSIVFEVSVTLVTSFDDFTELCGERLMVEQVVNPETRARGFRRVSRTNALLGGANAISK